MSKHTTEYQPDYGHHNDTSSESPSDWSDAHFMRKAPRRRRINRAVSTELVELGPRPLPIQARRDRMVRQAEITCTNQEIADYLARISQ